MGSEKGEKSGSIIRYKIRYTMLILVAYLLGKSIPLYGIDISAYTEKAVDAQTLLIQTISGDINRVSLFALGISPYMIASIIIQIIVMSRNQETKTKISPRKMNKLTITLTGVLALVQALAQTQRLQYQYVGMLLTIAKCVTVIELITGVMLVIWLCERNKKYGIGGQTAIIYVNILDGILATVNNHTLRSLCVPLLVSAVVLAVMVTMENSEIRLPVQRISIHNIYADKNYLAVKLNPIGVMPVMFSTGFFMLPQLLLTGLDYFFPENDTIIWWQQNMSLNKPVGIGIYILILYVLTVGFSIVFISPRDITEQFLKSGDSIINLHAGRDTKRYLMKTVIKISFFSATVMSVCLGIPMLLQLQGSVDATLAMLPSSIMILTGIWCNLYQEVIALKGYDSYKAFL